MLLSGLLGTVLPAAAGPGDVNVNVGGINSKPQQGSGPGSSRLDRTQTGLGSFSAVPDTTHRLDSLTGGAPLVPDTKSNAGGTTFPSSNTGTFSPTLPSLGQPSQFCSSTDVTVGENTQSKLHCSNTVNPVRP